MSVLLEGFWYDERAIGADNDRTAMSSLLERSAVLVNEMVKKKYHYRNLVLI